MWQGVLYGPGIAACRMAKMRQTCCHHISRQWHARDSTIAVLSKAGNHRRHRTAAVRETLAPGHAWPVMPVLSMLTALSMYIPGASMAEVMQASSTSGTSEQYQLAQAYEDDADNADSQRKITAQPASAPRPAFCQPDSIARVLSRYQGDIEGYGGIQSQAELLSFFERTCTQEELQAGLNRASYSKAEDADADTRSWLVKEGNGGLPEYWRVLLLQAGLVGVAGLAAVAIQCWMERPVGWVALDMVEVRPSSVAGKGLFARVDLPEGTVIGAYPGRVRTPANMQQKLSIAPLSEHYTFITTDYNYVDPTDESGLPSSWPQPGWPWLFPTPTELAYANEPPPSAGGTNCSVKDGSDPSELLFVTNRDCKAGEEIFIDYGRTYDRSGYGNS